RPLNCAFFVDISRSEVEIRLFHSGIFEMPIILVEQSVEMKTTPFISTEFVHFSLNCNILHDAKSGRISYICRTS
uniref:hypothetical protein n=1 Tax=Alistipes putredinis TaxID=28117 RepID=UPI003967CF78